MSQGDGAVVIVCPLQAWWAQASSSVGSGTSKGDHILLFLLPLLFPGAQVCSIVFFLLGVEMSGQSQEGWS